MSPFLITEHIFLGQHIREYPGALANSQEDALRLHAKSYTPFEVHEGRHEGDLTIIAFHANAFHKEVYEPFFEALYTALKDRGLTVGSIWIADQAAQGTSAMLNDEVLGIDSHWFDHSRDVLCMVNNFRGSMKRPLVAVGHSMGGTQAVATAHFHPRLFEAVIMLDPPMTLSWARSFPAMIKYILTKPESYASLEDAERAVRESAFFKKWDKRVLKRYIETAWHEKPTTTLPEASTIKPKTTLHTEVRTLARPNPDHIAVSQPISKTQRYTHPDVTPESPLTGPVYNPHTREAYAFLETLRPAAFFILGQGSQICPANELEHRTSITGMAVGGSGGQPARRVSSITIPGGHFLPMTNVQRTAEEAAKWLDEQLAQWRKTELTFVQEREGKSSAERQKLDPKVRSLLETWDGKPWAKSSKPPKTLHSKL